VLKTHGPKTGKKAAERLLVEKKGSENYFRSFQPGSLVDEYDRNFTE